MLLRVTTDDVKPLHVRVASDSDLAAIRDIYNQGIEDRGATLDEYQKSAADMGGWYAEHGGRYAVVAAERDETVVGWASSNPYSHRCAYRGVAELSVYAGAMHAAPESGRRFLVRSNGMHAAATSTRSCSSR